jgi:adenosylcobinamide-GDP ribazoletransferase
MPGLRLAVTLLTAVPLPGRRRLAGPGRGELAAAMYWAPLVGLAIGAACAGVLALAARYTGALPAAVLAIAAGALLTRALHLDGLADFADGLGSAKPAGQALDIMRRSDVGPFGVVTLVLVLLIQVSALARAEVLGRGPAAIMAGAAAGRLAITLACRRGVPAARAGGLGAMVAGRVHPAAAALLAVAAVAVAVAAGGWQLGAAVASGLAVSLVLTALAIKRLGGITGDVLGALAEITVTVCLLVMAFR